MENNDAAAQCLLSSGQAAEGKQREMTRECRDLENLRVPL